ncbi:tRNA (guanosine(46)-N7)-methyltransferase TrmB [Phenylobacterium sp. 58.2.17]|uniref:tRNA (guanosine(46)-N7)-methyltransferase TrmB n=1 Tax=Phenylobacterium sp. 58.2.17 TaxID=2969306 RepID=UPI0022651923|nr:tRNA (guanosine(46)-N7)-methyltransferase TrmB [Phenylobacterium sp. 58.2.17]MCX7588470.1 tRNA (guanosine(46)-N7)-methyltransferase TrmB [Phenylobacterium sp. 58.2.17]
MEENSHPLMRSYGRIKSRPIKPRQAALVEELLPALRPPQGPFDPRTLMAGTREAWLEIGFGGGEHMASQAARAPDVLIVGCEPFLNGVASAVRHVAEQDLKNVRIHDGDARELAARLPDASLDRVFILFPDPWPKARHHKRRIVQSDMVAELARVLKPGGRLRFATDVAGYADWALERILASPEFDWPAQRADDWRIAPADHITTRYEEKRLGDCEPVFFDFIRR